MKIENINIDDVKVKYGSIKQKDNLSSLTKSLQRYGQLYPILLNTNYEIIDGHNVYEILKQFGYREVTANIIDTTNINEKQLYLELHFNHLEINPIQGIKYIKEIDIYDNCLYLSSDELSGLQFYLDYDIKNRPQTKKDDTNKVRKVKNNVFKEDERIF